MSADRAAYYRFGPKAGVAELILARAVEDIYLRPLNGIGSSVYEELEFGAGDVTFREQYTLARIAAETPEITGDFTILSADESLADLTCDAGSVSDRDFEPQFTAKTNASQCWNPETFIWNGCL